MREWLKRYKTLIAFIIIWALLLFNWLMAERKAETWKDTAYKCVEAFKKSSDDYQRALSESIATTDYCLEKFKQAVTIWEQSVYQKEESEENEF